jgi:hypothetical protein
MASGTYKLYLHARTPEQMTCYFGKPDTIVIGLSFLSKILKYRLYSMDSSSVGVSKYIILHLGTYQMDVCIIFVLPYVHFLSGPIQCNAGPLSSTIYLWWS